MGRTVQARSQPVSRWPFWLLLAAWVCANVPPTTTLHVCFWLQEAEHFSHHAELRREVAGLISGRTDSPAEKIAVVAENQRDPAPALPAQLETRKSDFALSPSAIQLIALLPRPSHPLERIRLPASPVAEVPSPPPRAVAVA